MRHRRFATSDFDEAVALMHLLHANGVPYDIDVPTGQPDYVIMVPESHRQRIEQLLSQHDDEQETS
jgi:hypothetical protein